jgi:hypothetical protein
MRYMLKLASFLVCSLAAGTALASPVSATAVITDTPDSTTAGAYDYTITLNNTGGPIGTFWFAWVPGGNFLTPGDLISVTEPNGWKLASDANSIRYETISSAGDSTSVLTFGLESTETPLQLLGTSTVASGAYAGTYPDLTSFVLASNSSASTSTPGTYDEFVVTSDLTPTPEPSSIVLSLTGFAFVAFRLQTTRSRTA